MTGRTSNSFRDALCVPWPSESCNAFGRGGTGEHKQGTGQMSGLHERIPTMDAFYQGLKQIVSGQMCGFGTTRNSCRQKAPKRPQKARFLPPVDRVIQT
jgi:hypothetical protein